MDELLEAFAFPSLLALGLCMSVVALWCRRWGSVVGGVTMVGLTLTTWLATRFEPFSDLWFEGGPWMYAVFAIAAYGAGTAAATIVSRSKAGLVAAGACAVLASALAGYAFFDGIQQAEEVIREHVVDPEDQRLIREGSRGELTRVLALGGLGAATIGGLTLVAARRRRRHLLEVTLTPALSSSRTP